MSETEKGKKEPRALHYHVSWVREPTQQEVEDLEKLVRAVYRAIEAGEL